MLGGLQCLVKGQTHLATAPMPLLPGLLSGQKFEASSKSGKSRHSFGHHEIAWQAMLLSQAARQLLKEGWACAQLSASLILVAMWPQLTE